MFEAMVTELNTVVVAGLGRRELCDLIADAAKVRGALDVLDARAAVAVDELDDRGGDAETALRGSGHCSKREATRRARRARQLADMPNTTALLADGAITAEHADELARAAAATSAAEVDNDTDLLARAKARPADMAAKDIRAWTARRQSNTDREKRHRSQVARRSLAMFDGDDDMVVAHCRTDTVCGEQLRTRIEDLARQLHRHDTKHENDAGGADHTVRTWEQLRHDALMILTGITTHPDTRPGPDTTSPARGGDGPARTGGPARARVLVVVDAATLTGTNPHGRCEIPGVGPLPHNVLHRLTCDAEVLGQIFTGHGQPLWQGRGVRTATPAQVTALTARDGGCVICAAHPIYCEAHHIIPWAIGGLTDIDNLVLLCTRHHHELHDHNLTLAEHPGGHWTLTNRAPPQAAAA